jgi:phosphatidylinositol glycan class N
MPLLHSFYPRKQYQHRLLIVFLTFAPIFVILTISYEGLFYVVFGVTLVTWVSLEHQIYTYAKEVVSSTKKTNGSANTLDSATSSPFRSLTLSDARISVFFLTLIQSAFFSTGNIASVSSFSLDAVYRLIPVFDPFSQGSLLMLKLMVPFALISANLGILNKRLGVAPSALFMVVMAISDFLTLHFFWAVRDEGSWLEIGSTISHFAIASLLCVFVSLLEGVSEFFIKGVVIDGTAQAGNKTESSSKVEEKASNGSAKSVRNGTASK